jgi:hypothetical protein
VVNKSNTPDLQLSINSSASPTGAAVPVASPKQLSVQDAHWLQLLDLPSGTYILAAANGAKHQCKITIK